MYILTLRIVSVTGCFAHADVHIGHFGSLTRYSECNTSNATHDRTPLCLRAHSRVAAARWAELRAGAACSVNIAARELHASAALGRRLAQRCHELCSLRWRPIACLCQCVSFISGRELVGEIGAK